MNIPVRFPKILWISIVSLAIMMLLNLTGSIVKQNYFYIVVGIIDGLLIRGVIKGFRWVFWAITVLVFGGMVYVILYENAASIIASAFFDFLLFMPVFMHRKYFFTVNGKYG